MSAMSPETPDPLRMQLLERLRAGEPADEAVQGAKAFLEDHGYDWHALRAFLHPTEAEGSRGRPTALSSIHRNAYATLALCAAILIGVAWWTGLPDRHEVVTAAVFHEPGPPVFAGTAGEKPFHEMISAFRLEDPGKGLQQLRNLERAGMEDAGELSYFGGWFHYMGHDYDSAAERFSRVCADPATPYRRKAELMQAAALCLGRRFDTARALLRRITDHAGHPYRREAAAILADDRLW